MEAKTIARRAFWFLMAAAVLGIAAAAFYFYQYFTGRDAVLAVSGPEEVLLGVPFEIKINFHNDSERPLQNAGVSVVLPEDAFFVEESSGKRIFSKNIGELSVGAGFSEQIKVVIFGNEQAVKQFEIKAFYLPEALGPKAIFEKRKTLEVAVKEPAISLDLIVPQKVLSNEEFEIGLNYRNASGIDFSDVEIELKYPNFFSFKGASEAPLKGNNLWNIPKLKAGESGRMAVSGKVIAPEQSFFDIVASIKIGFNGEKKAVSAKAASVNVAPSPLGLSVKLNNQSNYVARLDDDLNYAIHYRNNGDVGLNDVIIKVKLKGEMLDFEQLRANGSFDSLNNVITFNAASVPGLKTVAPGEEGTVYFEVKTKEEYPIKRVSDKNFTLKLTAEISSPTVPYYVATDKTVTIVEFETKVAGKIGVNSQAFFKDAASGIVNKGFLPPKVNAPVNFTIHWTIVNYAADVQGAEVKGYLRPGVKWTGSVKSNAGAAPTYNERTQEIIWSVGKIPAAKGVVGSPIEAIFQVEAVPNITQISQEMPLVGETTIKATDEFTGLHLVGSAREITTRYLSDSGFEQPKGVVVP